MSSFILYPTYFHPVPIEPSLLGRAIIYNFFLGHNLENVFVNIPGIFEGRHPTCENLTLQTKTNNRRPLEGQRGLLLL